MILIAGSLRDGPIAAVTQALDRRGVTAILCDPATPLAGGHLTLVDGRPQGWLQDIDGLRIDLDQVRAVYARLVDHTRFAAYRALPKDQRHKTDAAQRMLALFLDLTLAPVLNPAWAMGSNRSKPYQIGLIRAHGFDVPPTLVTNDPDRARAFRADHGRVIFKSASWIRSIVTELDEDADSRLHLIRGCPVQFQALVPGRDIRVHVVGDRVFATACDSPVIDYRYAEGRAQLSQTHLPDDIRDRCIALAQALALPVAGIDLKHRPDGGWTCFEVNPSPGFSWFEQATGQDISGAIADRLLAG